MNLDRLTDEEIAALITLRKVVQNPFAQMVFQRGSHQCNYRLEAEGAMFEIYKRQNGYDPCNFSCGLSVKKDDGTNLTLLRYNGSNHPHGVIKYECHIHRATARAIAEANADSKSKIKVEGQATATDRYNDLEGALLCLLRDANVTGLNTQRRLPM